MLYLGENMNDTINITFSASSLAMSTFSCREIFLLATPLTLAMPYCCRSCVTYTIVYKCRRAASAANSVEKTRDVRPTDTLHRIHNLRRNAAQNVWDERATKTPLACFPAAARQLPQDSTSRTQTDSITTTSAALPSGNWWACSTHTHHSPADHHWDKWLPACACA